MYYKFWAKRCEILCEEWVNIGFWKYIWFNILGIVTCISKTYDFITNEYFPKLILCEYKNTK